VRKLLRNNGLSLSLFGFFLVMQIGLSAVGLRHYNNDRQAHHAAPITYTAYLHSSAFLEATAENWESEFLQMFAYVIFTISLYQRGSAESKAPDKIGEAVDADPRFELITPRTPWPVRRGGKVLWLYERSLSITLLLLFAVSFYLHALGGAALYSEEQLQHGEAAVTTFEYLGTAQFWFESLQNWQSEFFSIGLMVVLTVFLRQRGSPESKPVATPTFENS
jgi:hypothetical protein